MWTWLPTTRPGGETGPAPSRPMTTRNQQAEHTHICLAQAAGGTHLLPSGLAAEPHRLVKWLNAVLYSRLPCVCGFWHVQPS